MCTKFIYGVHRNPRPLSHSINDVVYKGYDDDENDFSSKEEESKDNYPPSKVKKFSDQNVGKNEILFLAACLFSTVNFLKKKTCFQCNKSRQYIQCENLFKKKHATFLSLQKQMNECMFICPNIFLSICLSEGIKTPFSSCRITEVPPPPDISGSYFLRDIFSSIFFLL